MRKNGKINIRKFKKNNQRGDIRYMKKRIKRVFALMLSLAMVVMGIQITPWQIKGADGESTNLPTSQEVTELHAPEKAYLCDFRTGSGGYKIVFEDADEDTYQMTGTDEKSFDVYVGTQKVTTVSESGTAVDISSWGFVDGETYEITVRPVSYTHLDVYKRQ